MTDRPFVHLHCHTHYSLLDGASRIPELVELTKKQGMNALAMTDHGNLFGAIEFYRECRDKGVNPIIGYEAYVAPGKRSEREAKRRGEAGFHLTLLAQNAVGFKNLIKLSSYAYLEGYHYVPRIDKELLARYKEGIICLSGCASSEFSEFILKEQMNEATQLAEWFAQTFGKNFYVEIQDNGLDIQKRCREGAVDIANRLGLPLVATCDAHYLRREDNFAHDVLLCINTGRTIKDENRMRYGSDQFYVRAPEEMYQLFGGFEAAVRRSQEIADGCDIQLDFKKRHFPVFAVPGGKTAEDYLRELCLKGLDERYPAGGSAENSKRRQAAQARLEHELAIICKMGFAGYFLIVWDFVRFAISQGIPASARGSACGAIVSYVLKLSHVCPLEYDLLFERFLDPNRSEAPDIDIDFCQDRREEVLNYVRQKYGAESVAQIGTFGTMAAKAALKDVGRALNIPLDRVIRLTAMVPQTLNVTLDEALEQSSDLRKEYDSDQDIRQLIDIARKLEGTNRNAGTHAAGVVIANGSILDYVPVQRLVRKGEDSGNRDEGVLTTQWVMGDIEKVGLLKMDFLGLRTLTVMENTVKLIRKTRGIDLELDRLPLDDEATFALLQKGDAKGVFQLESDGIRELLKRMKPDSIRDLIATNALYRPGPLGGGMVDAYINRKHGREKATYQHPLMEEILSETYGVLCLHEDTRVALANGTEKPIRHVQKGDLVHSLNVDTGRIETKECHGCARTRRGDGLEITLENGSVVVITPDHPLLTWNGFREAKDLDPTRDLLAAAIHTEPKTELNESLASWLGDDEKTAYLLGQLIGDGSLSGKTIALATGKAENHEVILKWLQLNLPKLNLNPYFHQRSWYIGISCAELLNSVAHGNRKTRFRFWIESLFLDVRSSKKHVPDAILQSSSAIRGAFLAGLLDSDGYSGPNKHGVEVCFYTSVSEKLLDGVARLCQLEGILFTRRPGRIHFWGQDKLWDHVGRFLLVRRRSGVPCKGQRLGWIPRSALMAKVAASASQRAFALATGIERSTLRRTSVWVRSDVAKKAGINLGDVRFYRIRSIREVHDQQFYGMSVADHHNLIANGIVAKNCYQEQVMRVLNRLGGIELASAYACIKAISKKKQEIIDARHAEFVKGSQERGLPAQTAESIFGLIVQFAGYGFNKSHSAAYAQIGYQTAYLKAHYLPEFMAALLTSEIDTKRDVMVEHIADARRLGVEVLAPDIQKSEPDFTVKDGKIVFGLTAIKGLGRGAAAEIVRARMGGDGENGELTTKKEGCEEGFKNLFDFCERIDHRMVTRAGIEKLIKAGAFDSLANGKRAALFDALPRALESAGQMQADRKHGQASLFDTFDAGPPPADEGLKDVKEWTSSECLKFEKEALDFYVTSHPLAQHEAIIRQFSSYTIDQLRTLPPETEVFLGGMITQIRLMNTKKARNGNSRYARCRIEDLTGSVECVMWPDDYEQFKEQFADDAIRFVRGTVERNREEPGLQLTRVLTLEQGQRERTTGLRLSLSLRLHGPEMLEEVARVLQRCKGTCPVYLCVEDGAGRWLRLKAGDSFKVNPGSPAVKSELETILGTGRVEFSRASSNGNGR